MNRSLNNFTKNKRKKIFIFSNDDAAKNVFFNTIYDNFKIINRKDREKQDITFEININKKKRVIKLTDCSNLEFNLNQHIDFSYIYRKDQF